MVYFILILFFASLVSIIFMVWRKLILVKSGQYQIQEGTSFEIPYAKEFRHLFIENIKKYEHESLVVIIKSYIQFSSFLKSKYQEIKGKTHSLLRKKYPNGELKEKIDSSKFLKLVSTYRHKIREITHKVKEEENNL